MSPLDIDLGVELAIVDEAPPSAAPTATDTCFLVHSTTASGSPSGVTEVNSIAEARDLFAGEALLAYTDAFFNIGGARIYVSPLDSDAAAAAALFSDQLGPGQLVAPEVVTSAEQTPLRDWAWDHNRIYIASAPDGVAKAAAITLGAGLMDDAGARNTFLEVDTIQIPGAAGGATREVSSAIVVAALMARSDIMTGNPNLTAAGNHTPGAGGQVDYAVGIKAERPFADIKELAQSQVNCFRTVNNRVRNYGYFTLADTDLLGRMWADGGGSRTVMATRALEQAVAEELMFGQVDATGNFLDKYAGQLSGVLAGLQRLGALYGTDQNPGYTVDVSAAVNPVSQVAQGIVKAQITMKTSPFAAELSITITRKAIDAA